MFQFAPLHLDGIQSDLGWWRILKRCLRICTVTPKDNWEGDSCWRWNLECLNPKSSQGLKIFGLRVLCVACFTDGGWPTTKKDCRRTRKEKGIIWDGRSDGSKLSGEHVENEGGGLMWVTFCAWKCLSSSGKLERETRLNGMNLRPQNPKHPFLPNPTPFKHSLRSRFLSE